MSLLSTISEFFSSTADGVSASLAEEDNSVKGPLWRALEPSGPCPSARHHHSMTAVDQRLVVIGGRIGADGKTRTDDVCVLDVVGDKWHSPTLRSIGPGPIDCHAAISIGGRIWIFGGRSDTHTRLSTVWTLDTDTWTWNEQRCTGTMPSPRSSASTAAIGTSIYVFGGFDGFSVRNDMYVLDTKTLEWRVVECKGQVPTARYTAAMISVSPSLWLFGGDDRQKKCTDLYEFSPDTNTWTEISSEGGPQPQYSHAMVALGYRLYVVGAGLVPNTASPDIVTMDVYSFDVEQRKWRCLEGGGAVSPSARSAFDLAAIESSIYLFGGRDSQCRNDVYVLENLPSGIEDAGFLQLPLDEVNSTLRRELGRLSGILSKNVSGTGSLPTPSDKNLPSLIPSDLIIESGLGPGVADEIKAKLEGMAPQPHPDFPPLLHEYLVKPLRTVNDMRKDLMEDVMALDPGVQLLAAQQKARAALGELKEAEKAGVSFRTLAELSEKLLELQLDAFDKSSIVHALSNTARGRALHLAQSLHDQRKDGLLEVGKLRARAGEETRRASENINAFTNNSKVVLAERNSFDTLMEQRRADAEKKLKSMDEEIARLELELVRLRRERKDVARDLVSFDSNRSVRRQAYDVVAEKFPELQTELDKTAAWWSSQVDIANDAEEVLEAGYKGLEGVAKWLVERQTRQGAQVADVHATVASALVESLQQQIGEKQRMLSFVNKQRMQKAAEQVEAKQMKLLAAYEQVTGELDKLDREKHALEEKIVDLSHRLTPTLNDKQNAERLRSELLNPNRNPSPPPALAPIRSSSSIAMTTPVAASSSPTPPPFTNGVLSSRSFPPALVAPSSSSSSSSPFKTRASRTPSLSTAVPIAPVLSPISLSPIAQVPPPVGVYLRQEQPNS